MDIEEGSLVRSAVCGSGVLEFAGWLRRFRLVVRRSREHAVPSNEEASRTSGASGGATEGHSSIHTSLQLSRPPLHPISLPTFSLTFTPTPSTRITFFSNPPTPSQIGRPTPFLASLTSLNSLLSTASSLVNSSESAFS